MLEPLVPLTRCPEFPDGGNVVPKGEQEGIARADSVGDSSGNLSPRHENMEEAVEGMPAAAAASPAVGEQEQQIHVEILEEMDDGDEGPGVGLADSILDEEEADRSSVDDAMEVAPLTVAPATVQGGSL